MKIPFFQNSTFQIIVPKKVETNSEGLQFLAKVQNEIKDKKRITLNFQETTFFEANLCAVLGAIIHQHKSIEGSKITLKNIHNEWITATFQSNGFWAFSHGQVEGDFSDSSAPLKVFQIDDTTNLYKYIEENITKHEELPTLSDGAKNKIARSIFEIFSNAGIHSGQPNIYLCGQLFRKKGIMNLTMVDLGETFKCKVHNHDPNLQLLRPHDCIAWAVKSGNTTKGKGETGGLGLDLIREFLKMNKGTIQIYSSNGYWEERKSFVQSSQTIYEFAGSIVNLQFNLRDNNSYFVRSELNPQEFL